MRLMLIQEYDNLVVTRKVFNCEGDSLKGAFALLLDAMHTSKASVVVVPDRVNLPQAAYERQVLVIEDRANIGSEYVH